MSACGYGDADVTRVKALIRKEKVKYDLDAEALEDVVCLVFIENYLAEFAGKHDEGKVMDILRKTWGKMSAKAQAEALKLKLTKQMTDLVGRALGTSS